MAVDVSRSDSDVVALQRVWYGYWGVLAERSSPYDPGSLIDAWGNAFRFFVLIDCGFPMADWQDLPYLSGEQMHHTWLDRFQLEWHLAPKEVQDALTAAFPSVDVES